MPTLVPRWVLVVAMGLPLAGCLSFEAIEVRVTREPGLGGPGRGRYSMTLRDVASDTEKDAQADFDALIQAWRGEDYLLDRVTDGCYAQRRDLRVEGGILVAREEGLIAGWRTMEIDTVVVGDSTFLERVQGKGERIETTNGRIVDRDGMRSARWPLEATEIRYVVKNTEFKKAADLVPRFEAWQKANRGHDKP